MRTHTQTHTHTHKKRHTSSDMWGGGGGGGGCWGLVLESTKQNDPMFGPVTVAPSPGKEYVVLSESSRRGP